VARARPVSLSAVAAAPHAANASWPVTRSVAALLAVAIVASSSSLAAWGPQGHRLVARIAEARLTPVARQNVRWLLDTASLADIASWADAQVDELRQTGPWHYVNIPNAAAGYDRDRDCPRQPGVSSGSRADRWRDCIVDRILYSEEQLADVALDRVDRAVALKFLVHLVDDIHQPLHALADERGGNGIPVTLFGSATCGEGSRAAPCNLDGIWDSGLIGRRRLSDERYLASLDGLVQRRRRKARRGRRRSGRVNHTTSPERRCCVRMLMSARRTTPATSASWTRGWR